MQADAIGSVGVNQVWDVPHQAERTLYNQGSFTITIGCEWQHDRHMITTLHVTRVQHKHKHMPLAG